MVREAPLRQDRAAAAHDARHAPGGERDVAQPDARVDREIVHSLLGLLDQRVAEDLPGELLRAAAGLFQRLVDRNGAHRHRAVAQDPFPRLVDVLARRKVHQRVAAPLHRPAHLLDLLVDRGGDRRVADVGVDLHQEVAADRHRLELGVVDVAGDDRPPPRDLVPDEFRGDLPRDRGAPGLWPGCWRHRDLRGPPSVISRSSRARWSREFSRIATNSISGVTVPWRA